MDKLFDLLHLGGCNVKSAPNLSFVQPQIGMAPAVVYHQNASEDIAPFSLNAALLITGYFPILVMLKACPMLDP